MEDLTEFGLMLDYYGEFLTENQYRAIELYLHEDWTITEIADYLNISRQGAHDFIKKSKSLLQEYEDKLHLVERVLKNNKLIEEITLDLNTLHNRLNDVKDKELLFSVIERLKKLRSES